MNQDFILNATPGFARTLVKLAAASNAEVDPAIAELAKTDLLTDEDFKPFPSIKPHERTAVQSLLDFGLRAIIPSSGDRGGLLTLVAAKLDGATPIVIVSERTKFWKNAAGLYGLKLDEDYFVVTPQSKSFMDSDFVKPKRQGLLIVDEMVRPESCYLYAKDFQKTVMLSHRLLMTDLSELIEVLFPGAPIDLLTNNNAMFGREVETMGFKSKSDLSFLMNIVPDLMIERKSKPRDLDEIDYETFDKLERGILLGHIRLG